jgi:hypothetical protein
VGHEAWVVQAFCEFAITQPCQIQEANACLVRSAARVVMGEDRFRKAKAIA